MSIPIKAKYKTGAECRFRFAYPRLDPDVFLQGKWTGFDSELISCASGGSTFVMHHESDFETRRKIAEKMQPDLRLPDGQKKSFLRRPTAYVIERDVTLQKVTLGRFDFGIWWDVAVASDADALLDTLADGENPQAILHEGNVSTTLRFLLFRNFHVDEVSIRTFDKAASDRVFKLATRHKIPLTEVSALDFYEGTFDLPEGALRISQHKRESE